VHRLYRRPIIEKLIREVTSKGYVFQMEILDDRAAIQPVHAGLSGALATIAAALTGSCQ
jgi:hypothetical protein